MVNRRSIFEIRYRPLLSVILTTIILLSAYTISLVFIPMESSSLPISLGESIDSFEVACPVWSSLFIWIGVLYISIGLAQNGSRFNIYGTLTPMPIELYVLLLMIMGGMTLRMLVVSLLIFTSLRRLFSSYKASNSAGILSIVALYMGIVPLLCPPAIVVWVGILPVMVLFDRSIHEVVVTLVSLVVPLFSYLYIAWLMGGDFVAEWNQFVGCITAGEGLIPSVSLIEFGSPLVLIRLACVALPILLYLVSLFAMSNLDNTVRAKRRVMVVAIFGGLSFLMLFLPSFELSQLPLLAIPLTLMIPIVLIKVGRGVSFAIYALLYASAIFSVIQRIV